MEKEIDDLLATPPKHPHPKDYSPTAAVKLEEYKEPGAQPWKKPAWVNVLTDLYGAG